MSQALPLSRLMEAVGSLDGRLELANAQAPAPVEAESAETFLGALQTAALLLATPQQPAVTAVADLLTELEPEAAHAETELPAPGAPELLQLVDVSLARPATSLEHQEAAPAAELGSGEVGTASDSAAEQAASKLEALAQQVALTTTGPSGNVATGPAGPRG